MLDITPLWPTWPTGLDGLDMGSTGIFFYAVSQNPFTCGALRAQHVFPRIALHERAARHIAPIDEPWYLIKEMSNI